MAITANLRRVRRVRKRYSQVVESINACTSMQKDDSSADPPTLNNSGQLYIKSKDGNKLYRCHVSSASDSGKS